MATHYSFTKISNCVLKVCAFMFRFACACHGLQSGLPNVRRFGLVFWFICALMLPFMIMMYVYDFILVRADRVSLSEIMCVIGCFNFMTSTFWTIFLFSVRHKEVEAFLQSSVRNAMDVSFPILSTMPLAAECVSIMISIKGTRYIFGYLSFIIFGCSMIVLFMVYVDVTNNLIVQLENLNGLIRRQKINWNALTLAKWNIREEIRIVNSLFANALSLHYLQLFSTTIFTFAAIMGNMLFSHVVCILLVNIVSFALQLYLIARKGSQLISQCTDTESRILKLFGNSVPGVLNSGNQLDVINVFRYREEWDSLRVAHFTLCTSGFLKYLSTAITCVAVVLQFDYKVMRAITTWAKVSSDC